MVWDLPLFISMLHMKEARLIAALGSMLAMIVLVVGALAYTAMHRPASPTLTATITSPVPQSAIRLDDSDPLVTPAAIVLALIAVLAVTSRRAAA